MKVIFGYNPCMQSDTDILPYFTRKGKQMALKSLLTFKYFVRQGWKE